MLIKRAIGFALLEFVLSSVVLFILSLFGLYSESFETYDLGLQDYIVMWIVDVPLVFLLAKWYFKKDPPTPKKGFYLGLITIALLLVVDGLSVVIGKAFNFPLDFFAAMYGDWKFYVSIVWFVALTTFVGWEFDATFSKERRSGNKEITK